MLDFCEIRTNRTGGFCSARIFFTRFTPRSNLDAGFCKSETIHKKSNLYYPFFIDGDKFKLTISNIQHLNFKSQNALQCLFLFKKPVLTVAKSKAGNSMNQKA